MIAVQFTTTPKGKGCRYISEIHAPGGYGHNGWKFATDRRLARILTWREVDLVMADQARGVLSRDFQITAP